MGPNERGWVEKTKDLFDYAKSVEETIQEMGDTGDPRVRVPRWGS